MVLTGCAHGAIEVAPFAPPQSEVELDQLREEVKSLHEAVTGVTTGHAIKEVFQDISSQMLQMQTKLSATAALATKVDALESKMSHLMEVYDPEAPQRAHQELLQKLHHTDSKLHELQRNQMVVTSTQQDLQAKLDSAISQVESQEWILKAPTTVTLARRLDDTNKELHTACGVIHEVQAAHAVVTEQLKQLFHARQSQHTGDVTYEQASEDLSALQQDLTDLRGEVHQTSEASQNQIRMVAETVESLRETLHAQQTSTEAGNAALQHGIEGPWHGSLQALNNSTDGIKQDLKSVQQLQDDVNCTRSDVEVLQGRILQIAQQMDQLVDNQMSICVHEPETISEIGAGNCTAPLFQEQLAKLTQQVTTIQDELNHLHSAPNASIAVRDEEAIAVSDASRCLKTVHVCYGGGPTVI